MKLIPHYRVSYQGAFYEAGTAFDIQPEDREEMARHGNILDSPPSPALASEPEPLEGERPKRGRSRRTEDG